MTAISTGWERPARTADIGARPGVFTRSANWVRRQIAIRRNRYILHGLSDRDLRDIGIRRELIDEVVEGVIDTTGRPRSR